MSKHNHKHKKLIPSPYKVVTEYEGEFVCQGNKMTANAMKDVLKYIANETAKAVKNQQGYIESVTNISNETLNN